MVKSAAYFRQVFLARKGKGKKRRVDSVKPNPVENLRIRVQMRHTIPRLTLDKEEAVFMKIYLNILFVILATFSATVHAERGTEKSLDAVVWGE